MAALEALQDDDWVSSAPWLPMFVYVVCGSLRAIIRWLQPPGHVTSFVGCAVHMIVRIPPWYTSIPGGSCRPPQHLVVGAASPPVSYKQILLGNMICRLQALSFVAWMLPPRDRACLCFRAMMAAGTGLHPRRHGSPSSPRQPRRRGRCSAWGLPCRGGRSWCPCWT